MAASWYSAQQIADMRLPTLPETRPGVALRAEQEGWRSRPRAGRGGGREYPITALPVEARAELLKREADAAPAQPSLPMALPADTTRIADWQRRTMDARAAILAELDRLAGVAGVTAAVAELITRAEAGTLAPTLQAMVPIANARGGATGTRTLSRRTLFRWREEAKRGVSALAPAAPASAEALPAWAGALMATRRQPMKPKLAEALRLLPDRLPEGVAMPSYDAARRFLARVSIVERERGRRGPNDLLAVQAFRRRSTDGLRPLDVVTADGHSFKGNVRHPMHGNPFKPEICTVLDVTTRYAFGWSAGLAESSVVVMDAIRCGVERLGQFGIFYTDNGSGFVAEAMTDEVTGFLARIGATPENATPGRAQSRGKIERLQQMWKAAARELPTYTGRDMDREAGRRVVKLVKQDLLERGSSRLLMEWADFLAWIGQVVARYNTRPHRGLPRIRDAVTGTMRHMSPAEALAQHRAEGWEPQMLPAPIIADLARPYEMRSTFRGEVRLPWGNYFHHDLVPHGGERVRVGYDVHDGSRVWVRTGEDGRLICVAQRDANVIPEQPASKVEHALQQRGKARLKLLEDKAALVRAETHGTPAWIEHAPEVVPALSLRAARIDAEHAETLARFAEPTPVPAAELNDEDRWYTRAQGLIAARDAGQLLTEDDAEWLGRAVTRPWFTARADFDAQRAAFMARTAPPVTTDEARKSA